jgi:hypothetical protein
LLNLGIEFFFKPKCEAMSKNLNILKKILNFHFCIATNYLLLKSKITSFLVGFCDFERVLVKIDFFVTRFKKLFFNEFLKNKI